MLVATWRRRLAQLFAILTVTTAGLVVTAAAPAAANVQTPGTAYKTARVCLLQHGARFVARRGDGGGYVFFKGVPHVQYWTYKTWLGLVEKVTYYAFPGLPAQTKRDFVACIMKGN
jgi:hypothetical protein